MDFSSTHFLCAPNVAAHDTVLFGDQTTIDHQSSSYHPTASSLSLFSNAQNFEVKDSQFNIISNAHVTINTNTTKNDPVSTILWPHVAAGAIFDSAARYAAGKCHPGTRKKMIEQIVTWIKNHDPTKRVLWLYGPAGAGKSALAHTICELLQDSHPENNGGSFFFASGPTDRGNAFKLFTTLSYQLAVRFPSIRKEINHTLSRDPSVITKSMETQFEDLIIQPLLRCPTPLPESPVLIIDGLDECANDGGTLQGDIVALISKYLVKYKIPLRFMVASRPEYWIRDAFETAPLPSVTLSLSLRDDVDADTDIKSYLTDQFEKIRVKNERFMRSVVLPWPPAKIIDRLVYEASGQYIYAATVLKFVGNHSKFSSPQKQLDIITSPGPHRALAFSELDRLYATILSVYPEWETMKIVLAGLLLNANTTIIWVVLGVDSDELALVLDALSSLIDIKKRKPLSVEDSKREMLLESIFGSLDDGQVTMTFSHRSFREFLQDQARSGPLFIDLDSDVVPNDIVKAFFDLIHRNLDQHYKTEPHIFLNIDFVTYHGVMQNFTLQSTSRCSLDILPHITHMTTRLELYDPGKLTRMHSVFYFACELGHLLQGLETLFDGRLLKRHEDEEKPEVLTEFRNACEKFKTAIKLAGERALCSLASCTDFKITPALVYLTEYDLTGFDLPITGLRTIVGVTDVISTLKEHRYIVPLWRDDYNETWYPHAAQPFFGKKSEPSWRTQGAWKDLRVFFAHRSVNSMFAGYTKDSDNQCTALTRFFNSQDISDIRNKEHFQNASNRAILGVMADLAAWVELLRDNWGRPSRSFLVSILCWINRHLTNPQTMTLLQQHDNTLQQKLTRTSKYIFEHGFLKDFTRPYMTRLCDFTRPYKTGLCVFSWGVPGKHNTRSIAIEVFPLPQGFHEEEMPDPYSASESWYPDDWQTFHDGLFGRMTGNTEAPGINPIIHPSDWHPHLVPILLKALVRYLYGRIHRDYSTEYAKYEDSFPYLTQCLPYAHLTRENLDAIRAIVYLYPQVTPAWNPPEGFWSLLVGLLHKYDRSILSSEEFNLFVKWLNSEEHVDIKTYII